MDVKPNVSSSTAGKGLPCLGGQISTSATECHWALLQCHWAYCCTLCKILALPWPVKSPDLSQMEYLWDILGRCVQRQPHKSQYINELADALQEEWHPIHQQPLGGSSGACGVVSQAWRWVQALPLKLLLNGSTDPYQTWSQVQVTWLNKNLVVNYRCAV